MALVLATWAKTNAYMSATTFAASVGRPRKAGELNWKERVHLAAEVLRAREQAPRAQEQAQKAASARAADFARRLQLRNIQAARDFDTFMQYGWRLRLTSYRLPNAPSYLPDSVVGVNESVEIMGAVRSALSDLQLEDEARYESAPTETRLAQLEGENKRFHELIAGRPPTLREAFIDVAEMIDDSVGQRRADEDYLCTYTVAEALVMALSLRFYNPEVLGWLAKRAEAIEDPESQTESLPQQPEPELSNVAEVLLENIGQERNDLANALAKARRKDRAKARREELVMRALRELTPKQEGWSDASDLSSRVLQDRCSGICQIQANMLEFNADLSALFRLVGWSHV